MTTTASATRAADSLSITGVTGLDYPLSLFAEFERAADTGGSEALVTADDNSSADRALLYVDGSDRAALITTASSVAQSGPSVAGALAIGTQYKAAARVTTNDIQMARSGTLATQDTSAANPATPSVVRFGASTSGWYASFGYLRRAAIWSRALTDAELQAVTL